MLPDAPRRPDRQQLRLRERRRWSRRRGFREYDARWLFGPEINLLGIQALGLGLGTYIHELGQTQIVVGHDFRSYSLSRSSRR